MAIVFTLIHTGKFIINILEHQVMSVMSIIIIKVILHILTQHHI